MKYEYKTVFVNKFKIEQELNILGDLGWKLIYVANTSNFLQCIFIKEKNA
jgi:hypothetical protein